MVERYQLEVEDEILVTFETKEAMLRFIQHELPQGTEYDTRTLH
jgi:hypothetical protein